MHRALDSFLPICIKCITLIGTHVGLKGTVNGPLLGNFLWTTPEADSETGKICSTEGGGLSNFWSLYQHTKNIGLELHKQVIDDSTAIDTQGFEINFAVGSHSLED